MNRKCSRCRTEPTKDNPVRYVNGVGTCDRCGRGEPRSVASPAPLAFSGSSVASHDRAPLPPRMPVDDDLDMTPGSIATVNLDVALALVAEADTQTELDALERSERASNKNFGGRKNVLKAISDRRSELAS